MTTLEEITREAARRMVARQADELLNPSRWIKAMMDNYAREQVEHFLSGAPDVGIGASMEYPWPGWHND